MNDEYEDLKDRCMNDPFWAADRITKLEAWKAEAIVALTHWDHVAEPIINGNAKYLGWYKWDAVAVELEQLQAKVRTSQTYPGFKQSDAQLDSYYDDPAFLDGLE